MSQLSPCCKKIDAQRKRAWRCYYQAEELLYETITTYNEKIKNLLTQAQVEFPAHFKNELLESLKDLDCPICLEPMTKDTFGLTKCFHKALTVDHFNSNYYQNGVDSKMFQSLLLK